MSPIKNETVIDPKREEIESTIDASNIQIFGIRELKRLLQPIINQQFYGTEVTVDNLITFLIQKSQLKKIQFLTPRIETFYRWRTIDNYMLMPNLRPNGYYSHLTALYFHHLLDHEPNNIYFNNEQPARPATGDLEQSRIDNAFRGKQRITTAKTEYQGKVYWLLNGKQTGNYSVIELNSPSGLHLPVTNLERTLIDITVRPGYAGGVESVLKAYRLAQSKISIDKLSKALRKLDYKYPYHQSVGLYIELAGNYEDKDSQTFFKFQPIHYDFYLDYGIKNPAYSKKWKIYYPKTLL